MKNNAIFLIGFMGAGKSTVAKALTNLTKMSCLEMDQEIVERQQMTIAEIFEKKGEAFFRDLETELLEQMQTKDGCIVSCGGGVVMRDKNVALMKKIGKIVLLTAEPQTIYERVKEDGNRPILAGHMDIGYIEQLMQKRRPHYEKAADLVVATDGKDADTIGREILQKIAATA